MNAYNGYSQRPIDLILKSLDALDDVKQSILILYHKSVYVAFYLEKKMKGI